MKPQIRKSKTDYLPLTRFPFFLQELFHATMLSARVLLLAALVLLCLLGSSSAGDSRYPAFEPVMMSGVSTTSATLLPVFAGLLAALRLV